MSTRRIKITYPPGLITEPVVYRLGRDFQVETNIRRAEVNDTMGWVVLELDGDDQEIDRSLKWVTSLGVRVDPVSGDVIEG